MKKNKQIFYDRYQTRWRYSRAALVSFGVFIFLVFAVAIGSLFVRPVLPKTSLQPPVSIFRGAPNVPNSVNANNNQTLKNTASQNAVSFNSFSGSFSNSGRRMIGFYVNWDDNSLTSLEANISHLDELMPEWYHLAGVDAQISVDDQDRQDQTMQFIKQTKPTLQISPLINNFNQSTQDWDSGALSKMLSSEDSRKETIYQLKDIVQRNNFSGISIDFESVSDGQQANLILFMQELYGTFHPLNLEVSENVPMDDDSYDLKTLSNYSDFLILMAYDEHSIYDSTNGPVASQGWFSTSLAKQMKVIPPEKLVVALGGYGYDWLGREQSGDEVTFQDAVRIAKESQGNITLDEKSLNPSFEYYDDNNAVHHVWFLDAVSTFDEMMTTDQLGSVRGFALWRLGSEDPSVWNIFDSHAVLDSQSVDKLKTVEYGYDVDYEGSGEILQVTSSPQVGKRTLIWDPNSGLITAENVTDFPSSYDITRWGGSDSKKLAITFDDGPDANYTPKILDILKKYNVPATFFVIGSNANSNQGILKRIVDDGNEIGNHTYTHPNISAISAQQFNIELDATERLFEGVLGRKSLLFRPPYSEDVEPNTPDQVQPLIATKVLGYYTVGMHIDPSDWNKPGTDQIVNTVVSEAQNGDGNIILLHDSGGNRDETVAALPQIIERLQAQGFQFVTVSDLMGLSRDQVMPKISPQEQIVARINGIAFSMVSSFNNFINTMFFTGIVLGLSRLLIIGILAIIQYVHSRYGKFNRYCLNCNFLVDVIIPAYNEEKVILKTIEDILHSTYKNFQIIVVDDGSNDQTYQVVEKRFGKNPQVSIYTKRNGGKSDALNFGIERSIGEIIITLDADTLFRPNTIEKIVRRFVDRRIAAVAGNAKVGNRTNMLTRWQALEYITSQNFDRRAFELLNCISVVPGAVGAWRRSALIEAGGFSSDTLAEDADLTFAILENGHKVAYDDEAIGLTEAPDTVRNFLSQRFRWMYGTLQTAWKHKKVFFRPRYKALGFFAIPNTVIFQIFFPLISPLMDLMLLISVAWAFVQRQSHQIDFSADQSFRHILTYYIFFTLVDMLTAAIPFLLEHKEDWTLLFWMPLQRFFYRQLIYYVAIKSVATAVIGQVVGWGKFERTATVEEPVEERIVIGQ